MVSTYQKYHSALLLFGCIFAVLTLFHLQRLNLLKNGRFQSSICVHYLKTLSSLGLRGIIVDLKFLEKCHNGESYEPGLLKIAVPLESTTQLSSIKAENVTIQLISYSDDPTKYYWKFNDEGTVKAVPRLPLLKVYNFEIPANPKLFSEYWNRSRLLQCKKFVMKRNNTSRMLPMPYSLQKMALLRDLLVGYGMFPYLQGGSLLGWYRECDIIPHTTDIDFTVPIEQFNPQFEKDVLARKTNFRIKRRLGMINDSLEYTIRPINDGKPSLDIFFMYKENEQFWVGGTGGAGEKFRYYYPSFIPNCSADLGGHLFWVTCNPDDMLTFEYGEWHKDHPSSNYSWNRSGKNIKLMGKWSKEVLADVVPTF